MWSCALVANDKMGHPTLFCPVRHNVKLFSVNIHGQFMQTACKLTGRPGSSTIAILTLINT